MERRGWGEGETRVGGEEKAGDQNNAGGNGEGKCEIEEGDGTSGEGNIDEDGKTTKEEKNEVPAEPTPAVKLAPKEVMTPPELRPPAGPVPVAMESLVEEEEAWVRNKTAVSAELTAEPEGLESRISGKSD